MSKEIANQIIEQWIANAPDEIKPMWRKITVTHWERKGVPMCTLQWSYFNLDIATFAVPDTVQTDIISDQMMVWNAEGKKPVLTHQSKNPDGELATVYEIIDEFLLGNWTPHWHCYKCRERHKGKIKPH